MVEVDTIKTVKGMYDLTDSTGKHVSLTIEEVRPAESFWSYLGKSIAHDPVWKCIIGMCIFSLLKCFLVPGGCLIPEGMDIPKVLADTGWSICAISWCFLEFKRLFKKL